MSRISMLREVMILLQFFDWNIIQFVFNHGLGILNSNGTEKGPASKLIPKISFLR